MLKKLLASAAFAAMMSGPALAVGIGEGLTPMGAEQAGNADGSIPAWDGGLTTPPAGYSPGQNHIDPFAGEQPLFTIDASNYQQYADNLTPGQIAMFEAYGDTWKMNVYPSHRTAGYPQSVYDATAANISRAQLDEGGNGVIGAQIGVPFPKPTQGIEVLWNHVLRFRGEAVELDFYQINPTSSGNFVPIRINQKVIFRYAQADRPADENFVIYFMQDIKSPTRLAGTVLLVHETINQVKQRRLAWVYNPGQRRVRRAPDISYDNPGTASDGQRTSDQLDMYNGAPDRFDWTLVGKQEVYVPYNSYKLHSEDNDLDDIIQAKHMNTDLMRFEKHRAWVIEGNLKGDKRHIYSRRTYYVDEDSWQIMAAVEYDGRGQIWRVGESHSIQYYEYPLFWSTGDAFYDLQNGRYTVIGVGDENAYEWDPGLTIEDFSPDRLRASGVR